MRKHGAFSSPSTTPHRPDPGAAKARDAQNPSEHTKHCNTRNRSPADWAGLFHSHTHQPGAITPPMHIAPSQSGRTLNCEENIEQETTRPESTSTIRYGLSKRHNSCNLHMAADSRRTARRFPLPRHRSSGSEALPSETCAAADYALSGHRTCRGHRRRLPELHGALHASCAAGTGQDASAQKRRDAVPNVRNRVPDGTPLVSRVGLEPTTR